jgi:hypothetical protein
MDWFDQEERFSEDYDRNYENIFNNKYTENDYDLNMDDFVVDYTKESKLGSPQKGAEVQSSERATDSHTDETERFPSPTRSGLDSGINSSTLIPRPSLSVSERMRYKKEKTKKLLEHKTQRTVEPSCHLKNLPVDNTNTSFTKKEIKMMRNRISAQMSRDRKKKELDDLRTFSQNLARENMNLKKELSVKNKEINEMKSKLNSLCEGCNNKVNGSLAIIDNNLVRSSRAKYSLVAAMLAVFGIIGTFALPDNKTLLRTNTAPRVLMQNFTNTPLFVKENYNSGVMPYKPENKQLDVYISNRPITKEYEELSLLDKKRFDMIVKLESQNLNHKFLNDAATCPNTDFLYLSIVDENPNSLLPGDNEIVHYDLNVIENDFYKNSLKSMYIKDYLTNNQDPKFLQNLFERINTKVIEKYI